MKVVILALNSLHHGYVGCYGNDWIDTPHLDRLAAEGVVFDRHYADRPDVEGARRAWRTGRFDFPQLDPASAAPTEPPVDLIRLLGQQHVTTCLIRDESRPVPQDFRKDWNQVIAVQHSSDGDIQGPMSDAVSAALDRLEAAESWLLWVDWSTLLPPWNVPRSFQAIDSAEVDEHEDARGEEALDDETLDGEPDDDEQLDDEIVDEGDEVLDEDEELDEEESTPEDDDSDYLEEEILPPLIDPSNGFIARDDDSTFIRLQQGYAGAVRYVDDGVRLILEELAGRDLYDDTLIVVTSDRGMALGEHGMVGDFRPWLHEELVHVPLIVRLPGGSEAGRRVSALTQPVDLLPTLLEAFKLAAVETHGHSLWPLLHGSEQPLRAHACSGLRIGEAVEWSLRTPEWAFLLPIRTPDSDAVRSPQFYVKPDDRWEVNDVIQHHLELADEFEATLRSFVASNRGTKI